MRLSNIEALPKVFELHGQSYFFYLSNVLFGGQLDAGILI